MFLCARRGWRPRAAQPAAGWDVRRIVRWAAQPAVGSREEARSSHRPLGGPTSGRGRPGAGSFVGSSAGWPNQRSGRPGARSFVGSSAGRPTSGRCRYCPRLSDRPLGGPTGGVGTPPPFVGSSAVAQPRPSRRLGTMAPLRFTGGRTGREALPARLLTGRAPTDRACDYAPAAPSRVQRGQQAAVAASGSGRPPTSSASVTTSEWADPPVDLAVGGDGERLDLGLDEDWCSRDEPSTARIGEPERWVQRSSPVRPSKPIGEEPVLHDEQALVSHSRAGRLVEDGAGEPGGPRSHRGLDPELGPAQPLGIRRHAAGRGR